MTARVKKAILTKAVKRCIKRSTAIKMFMSSFDGGNISIILVPNSNSLIYKKLEKETNNEIYREVLTIPRTTDFIVRIGKFEEFLRFLKN